MHYQCEPIELGVASLTYVLCSYSMGVQLLVSECQCLLYPCSNHPLSAEQVQFKLNELTMRRDQIQSMMDSLPSKHDLDAVMKKLHEKEGTTKTKISTASEKLACLRMLCQTFFLT